MEAFEFERSVHSPEGKNLQGNCDKVKKFVKLFLTDTVNYVEL
jgi:hypothetical protein